MRRKMPAIIEPLPSEVITVVPSGAAMVPRRRSGHAVDRVAQLTGLLTGLVSQGMTIDQLVWRKSLEARAPASIKALANDLSCYAAFHHRAGGIGLPLCEAKLVAYLDDCEERNLSPATVGRRIASLAVVHGLLGVSSPTLAPVVRDAMRGFRKRHGRRQRQAGPLRYGEGIGIEAAKGFTLFALLEACPGTVVGLRDAALLSLGYDAGLRVSELVAIDLVDISRLDDGAGVLDVVRSKTDQEGRGGEAWLSPDTMRRIDTWREAAMIASGPLFRRIVVNRRKVGAVRRADSARQWSTAPAIGDLHVGSSETRPMSVHCLIGEEALTPAAVRLIIKRTALRAAECGLVSLIGKDLDRGIAALSTHSLRVGLTQDLFANGEDAGPIAQALRWTSTATALRYGRKLAPVSNATARMLRHIRG